MVFTVTLLLFVSLNLLICGKHGEACSQHPALILLHPNQLLDLSSEISQTLVVYSCRTGFDYRVDRAVELIHRYSNQLTIPEGAMLAFQTTVDLKESRSEPLDLPIDFTLLGR